MGFTKLDSGLLKSSILAESLETFKVWIVLLAACDENGVAEVSPIYLESICRIPIAKVCEALTVLESPDEHSRSENDDGRRIVRVDGGYRILNYRKYRIKSYSKSKEAIRKREWRGKHPKSCPTSAPDVRDTLGHVPNVPDISASASCIKEDSEEGKTEGEPLAGTVRAVVSYLNEKTGKRFSPKSSDTIKHISARLNEGRTVDDFKRVIDVKCAKWKGKTWNDTRPGREGQIAHGDDFLCPATLFCAKNFETYLNERPAAQKMTMDEWQAEQDAELKRLRGQS